MKQSLKLMMVLMLLFLLSACSLKEKDKLYMVTEAGFFPYEYYENNQIVGIDIDIANEIAKSMDKKLVIKDTSFDSIINEIQTGKSDMALAGISRTKEREREVLFSDDYATSRQVIIVKKNSNIKDINQIKKASVQLGTIADLYLSKKYKQINLIREKKFIAAFEDLKSDKVEAVIMDDIPAKELITKDMIILDKELVTDNYGVIVKKGNEKLLNKINKVIRKLKEEDKIKEFSLKHLGLVRKKKSYLFQTFIENKRYNYIIKGVINTLIMAFGSIIIGLIIGIILGIIRNYHDNTGNFKLPNYLAKLYITVIRGTPSILQLMILYYVIFARTNINILLVGLIAFGINSGAYVAEIIRAGINSVSMYQVEAAVALGLKYYDTMKYVIFPQAIKNILPALGNELITLVKETAVGAYIGIMELTKASDIIASRTYNYFFPLIIIAMIYLLITYSLSYLFKLLEKRLNNVRN